MKCRNWWQTAVKIWRTIKGTAGEKFNASAYGNSFHPPQKRTLTSFPEMYVSETYLKHITVPFQTISDQKHTCHTTASTRTCDCTSSSKTYKALQQSTKTLCDWRSFGDKVIRRYLVIFWTPSVAVESAKTNVYKIKKKYDKSMKIKRTYYRYEPCMADLKIKMN